MIKKLYYALFLLVLANTTQAQLVNDGATITVKAGAVLFVESNVQNNGTGTITVENGGTLEVQGNFTNAPTAVLTNSGTLKFTGNAASQLTSGGDVIANLDISKVGSTVALMDATTVGTNLNFNSTGSSKLVLSANNLNLGATTTVTGADSDEYIVADAAGMVVQSETGAGTRTFYIGDANNYTPLTSVHSGTYASANLSVNVVDPVLATDGHPSKPSTAESYLSRYWNVDATGITGYSNTLTGTYVASDVNGTEALIKGANYGTAWNYAGASNNTGAKTVTGTTTDAIDDFTGTNFYGKVNLKAFLSGNFNTGTNLMNTNLNLTTGVNILGKFAVNSPYTDAFAAVIDSAFFPNHPTIVDWVKLEVFPSSQANGNFPTSAAIAKVSALLLSNGSIVSPTDATSVVSIKNADVNSKIKIVHRNHLPVRTDAAVPTDSNNPAPVDFTTGTTAFYNNGTGNNPMNLFNTTYNALWQANVNSIKSSDTGPLSANVDLLINAIDLGLEKTNTSVSASNVYSIFDLNLDKNKNAVDFGIAKSGTAVTKTADL